MTHPDDLMHDIMEAIGLFHRGEMQEARRQLTRLWDEVTPNGDPFQRCAVAHYLADLQDNPQDELAWDLRALEAASAVTDEHAKTFHGAFEMRRFYPSLHLNLASDYSKLGDVGKAREHLALTRERLAALPDDDFTRGIHAAVSRLTKKLDEG
ncbi:MAG: hypothetical protein AB2A00_29655 [Myxococcota bacterium]